ncbi:methyltransferase domain-containing protein [Nakamurella sp. YIM 132087]|uniref:Methyltransferase domain-containing protein n=1 Tax=Nakamurella alba TaxID=2665158 RepID=A0A7K1FNX2_9ACTN|nr:class I SAM-dependent methyltransferase [Nakamurella alba]MTD15780.1 methyltransferase domain-containing protein [Nakamurella alba]
MKTGLTQRGRAHFAFLAEMAGWSGRELQKAAAADLATALESVELPENTQAKLKKGYELLEPSAAFAWDRFYTRVSGEHQYVAALEAYEDGVTAIEAEYADQADAGGTLVLDESVAAPKYWTDTEFHLAPGGWEGHPRMGFMIHDYIYDLLFATGGVGAVKPGESFADQRYVTAKEGRKDSYRNILELGVGTGRMASALQRAWPDAQIHGVDLGESELRHAKLIAARNGWKWDLRQAAAEELPYDEGTFDMVAAFILLHEVPVPVAKQIIGEAFRVLEPGGELIIGDVAPYTQQESLFRSVVLDWETDHRCEPFWRGALLIDRGQIFRDAGFVEVEEYGVGPGNYPWVTRGVKPA